MKTKIEESMIKKPVFVTLLKTGELLVLITKRFSLKIIFRVISIFAVLTDCTLDSKVPVLLILDFSNGILMIPQENISIQEEFSARRKKKNLLDWKVQKTYKPIYTSAGQ